jgi:hypothetical protein
MAAREAMARIEGKLAAFQPPLVGRRLGRLTYELLILVGVRRRSYSTVLSESGEWLEVSPTGWSARAGAAAKALGRGLGKGVCGEDRTRSHASIEPTIRAMKANTSDRLLPTSSTGRNNIATDAWNSHQRPKPPSVAGEPITDSVSRIRAAGSEITSV